MKKLLTQATLEGYVPRADKSFTLRFRTSMEVDKAEAAVINSLFQSNVTLYFKSDEVLSTDEISQIDKVVLDKPTGKSQSERLRNVLYIYCKQKIGKEPTKEQFAEFYQKYTEKYIQYIKDQLD